MIGCSAGFLNVPKIKGTHTAMKSAMLAAEAAFENFQNGEDKQEPIELSDYEKSIRESWVWEELNEIRNVRQALIPS